MKQTMVCLNRVVVVQVLHEFYIRFVSQGSYKLLCSQKSAIKLKEKQRTGAFYKLIREKW